MPEPQNHTPYISLREFEQRHQALQDIVAGNLKTIMDEMARDRQDRKESLSAAASAIQLGLDKAERTLQAALVEAEKRVNEKFEPVRASQDKFDARLTRIEQERPLYVTRDQLDLVIKSVAGEVRPLERAAAATEGRAGISMPLMLALATGFGGLIVFLIELVVRVR